VHTPPPHVCLPGVELEDELLEELEDELEAEETEEDDDEEDLPNGMGISRRSEDVCPNGMGISPVMLDCCEEVCGSPNGMGVAGLTLIVRVLSAGRVSDT
jgi:hypothetical protein